MLFMLTKYTRSASTILVCTIALLSTSQAHAFTPERVIAAEQGVTVPFSDNACLFQNYGSIRNTCAKVVSVDFPLLADNDGVADAFLTFSRDAFLDPSTAAWNAPTMSAIVASDDKQVVAVSYIAREGLDLPSSGELGQ